MGRMECSCYWIGNSTLNCEFYFLCRRFLLDEIEVDLACDITESNAFDVHVYMNNFEF